MFISHRRRHGGTTYQGSKRRRRRLANTMIMTTSTTSNSPIMMSSSQERQRQEQPKEKQQSRSTLIERVNKKRTTTSSSSSSNMMIVPSIPMKTMFLILMMLFITMTTTTTTKTGWVAVTSALEYPVYFTPGSGHYPNNKENPLGGNVDDPLPPDGWDYIERRAWKEHILDYFSFMEHNDYEENECKANRSMDVCENNPDFPNGCDDDYFYIDNAHKQSPIIVKYDPRVQDCNDRHEFHTPEDGQCLKGDALFTVKPTGLYAEFDCGSQPILDYSRNEDDWIFKYIELKVPGEHAHERLEDGTLVKYPAELHLVHKGTGLGHWMNMGIVSVWLDAQPHHDENDELERYIVEWEHALQETYDSCFPDAEEPFDLFECHGEHYGKGMCSNAQIEQCCSYETQGIYKTIIYEDFEPWYTGRDGTDIGSNFVIDDTSDQVVVRRFASEGQNPWKVADYDMTQNPESVSIRLRRSSSMTLANAINGLNYMEFQISFYLATESVEPSEYLTLQVCTTSTECYDIGTFQTKENDIGQTFDTIIVSNDGSLITNGFTSQMTFRFISNGNRDNDEWYLDNIHIQGIPVPGSDADVPDYFGNGCTDQEMYDCCDVTTSPTSSPVTTDQNDASLSPSLSSSSSSSSAVPSSSHSTTKQSLTPSFSSMPTSKSTSIGTTNKINELGHHEEETISHLENDPNTTATTPSMVPSSVSPTNVPSSQTSAAPSASRSNLPSTIPSVSPSTSSLPTSSAPTLMATTNTPTFAPSTNSPTPLCSTTKYETCCNDEQGTWETINYEPFENDNNVYQVKEGSFVDLHTVTENDKAWRVSASSESLPATSLRLRKQSSIELHEPVDATVYDKLKVSFYYATESVEQGQNEVLTVELVSVNENNEEETVIVLDTFVASNDEGTTHEIIIDSNEYGDAFATSNVNIRFSTNGGGKNDIWYLDDIKIEGLVVCSEQELIDCDCSTTMVNPPSSSLPINNHENNNVNNNEDENEYDETMVPSTSPTTTIPINASPTTTSPISASPTTTALTSTTNPSSISPTTSATFTPTKTPTTLAPTTTSGPMSLLQESVSCSSTKYDECCGSDSDDNVIWNTINEEDFSFYVDKETSQYEYGIFDKDPTSFLVKTGRYGEWRVSSKASIRLRQTSSILQKEPFDASQYDLLKVTFYYATYDVEDDNNDTMFVELWNDYNSEWQVLDSFTSNNNEGTIKEMIVHSQDTTVFTTNSKIQFRTNGSSSRNNWYLDDIHISGGLYPCNEQERIDCGCSASSTTNNNMNEINNDTLSNESTGTSSCSSSLQDTCCENSSTPKGVWDIMYEQDFESNTIESYDVEGNGSLVTTTSNDEEQWRVSSLGEFPNVSMRLNKTSTLTLDDIVLNDDYEKIQISFYYVTESVENSQNELLVVEVWDNVQQVWNIVEEYTSSNKDGSMKDISLSDLTTNESKIRFRTNGHGKNDKWFLDDITVKGYKYTCTTQEQIDCGCATGNDSSNSQTIAVDNNDSPSNRMMDDGPSIGLMPPAEDFSMSCTSEIIDTCCHNSDKDDSSNIILNRRELQATTTTTRLRSNRELIWANDEEQTDDEWDIIQYNDFEPWDNNEENNTEDEHYIIQTFQYGKWRIQTSTGTITTVVDDGSSNNENVHIFDFDSAETDEIKVEYYVSYNHTLTKTGVDPNDGTSSSSIKVQLWDDMSSNWFNMNEYILSSNGVDTVTQYVTTMYYHKNDIKEQQELSFGPTAKIRFPKLTASGEPSNHHEHWYLDNIRIWKRSTTPPKPTDMIDICTSQVMTDCCSTTPTIGIADEKEDSGNTRSLLQHQKQLSSSTTSNTLLRGVNRSTSSTTSTTETKKINPNDEEISSFTDNNNNNRQSSSSSSNVDADDDDTRSNRTNAQHGRKLNFVCRNDLKEHHVDYDHFCPYELYRGTENPYYYRYYGSLTSPPCIENVRWRVMVDPLPISMGQLTRLEMLIAKYIDPETCQYSTWGNPRTSGSTSGLDQCKVDVNRPLQYLTEKHKLEDCEKNHDGGTWSFESITFENEIEEEEDEHDAAKNSTNTTKNDDSNAR